MKISRGALCSSAGLLFTLATFGCGSGDFTPPLTVIAATANPLVAQYSIRHFHSGLTAWVEFGTDATYGRQTSVMTDSVTSPRGTVLNILVAGMLPQTTYHMRAHVDWAGGSWVDRDQTFTTGALPGTQMPNRVLPLQFPGISVTLPTPGFTPPPGVELLSLTSAVQSVAVDLQGNVIWFCRGNAEPVKPMQNGHFIIVRPTDLEEVDLACNVVRDVSYAQVNQSLSIQRLFFYYPAAARTARRNPFHHDVLVLPNGHWIGLCEIARNFTDLSGHPGTTERRKLLVTLWLTSIQTGRLCGPGRPSITWMSIGTLILSCPIGHTVCAGLRS